MQKPKQETYKDYLVRTVTEEIGKAFEIKIEEVKKELLEMDYKVALESTEEILKNYKKLKDHITLTKQEKEELLGETKEYQEKQIESIMTGLFSEDELYLESLLKSRCKTKMFIAFIDGIFERYLNVKSNDKIEIRKRTILKELYIKGAKQSEFIYKYYEVDRTFYTDKDRLLKDLAPYFFGIKGINI